MFSFLKYYLPIIIWYSLIFYLSSLPDLKTSPDPWQDFILRKLAHLLEYFILGVLLSRVFYKDSKKTISHFFLTTDYRLLTTLILLALADEVHQYFIPLRDGRIIDILIDTFGGVLGIIFFIKLKSRAKIEL